MQTRPHYLIIEPYYGGSHQAFLSGLSRQVEARFTLLSLPARKWKLRMQLSAPFMAQKIIAAVAAGAQFDAIFTSSFIDVAVLRALLAQAGISIPLGLYFHENQLAYPIRPQDRDRFQFALINCTSALCADAVAFNSSYNRETFLQGIQRFTQKSADFPLDDIAAQIRAKSVVLYPGMDFTDIRLPPARKARKKPAVIVWNHRWEHDKNPEEFFEVLFEIQESGQDFGLIVLGESFRSQPAIFSHARERLAPQILHFGYSPTREAYCDFLSQGSIVVSTAHHEFFGISVLEAVRAGCHPLVPDRLSYQELFPQQYRYQEGQLKKTLSRLLNIQPQLAESEAKQLTEPYAWERLRRGYQDWLHGLQKAAPAQAAR